MRQTKNAIAKKIWGRQIIQLAVRILRAIANGLRHRNHSV